MAALVHSRPDGKHCPRVWFRSGNRGIAATLEAVRLARSGKLGELKFFSSDFSMRVDDDNIRVQRETKLVNAASASQ